MTDFSLMRSRAAVFAVLLALSASPAWGADAKSAEDERPHIEKLKSDAPKAEKAMACKKLTVCGSKEAVPALLPLLADPQLSSWARTALEAIPGAEADGALIAAAQTVEGRLLVGVINSLGVRRSAGAVDLLSLKLKQTDADVASAAAVALGQIGNPQAVNVLRTALADSPATVKSAVAEGCLVAAERLAAAKNQRDAIALFDAVRTTDVPRPRVLEATRGAILASGSEGVSLLAEQLKSTDQATFRMGLMVARELPGREASDAVAKEAAGATPERAALLMLVLKDRDDQVASPAVLAAAKSGAKPLRLAALNVVRRGGDVSCVPVLLEIAVEADAELAQAARAALAGLSDKKVDAEIASRLARAEGPALKALVDVAGQRRVAATAPLLKAADSSDAQLRAAALTALGATVSADELPLLIARASSPKHEEDAVAAQKALRVAAVRMADREACAEKLLAATEGKPVATRVALLEVVGAVGGTKALAGLAAAGKQADPQLQDVATKALGEWMTVDAAPVLLDLAKNSPGEKYQIRALRGSIRIARQFTMPDKQRAEICRGALAAATRPAEQKLVLEVLERYPNQESLTVARDAAQIGGIKDEATRVASAIAKRLDGKK